MIDSFKRIGLFAKYNSKSIVDTFEKVINFLDKQGYSLIIETQSNALLSQHRFPVSTRETLGQQCDLVIVVGGDGSLLNAARAIAPYQVPVLGINRGRLGFLADILPSNFEQELAAILEGAYIKEKRFFLNAKILRQGQTIKQDIALNDIVLYSGNIARMIDFELYINDHFVLHQQADGIITATPTGSTAYALSAGGPILYPTLNAITITPMCPHTLSSRPIVVDNSSHIKLIVADHNQISPQLSYDGQLHLDLEINDQILIEKYPTELILIHPVQHEYFSVLREKLGWNTHVFKD
jgi:NAD+ kinase